MNTQDVLAIFKEITRIPRESGHEGPMTEFLLNWAAKHGLEAHRDEIGNVCITKEASRGKENVPALVLQAHQDMVCEKVQGSKHDFLHDPIEYVIEDGWMLAKDTTLGADDGIGVAAALALLQSDDRTGKLECVFTVSEETGMDGAEYMKSGFFTGKTLINLDSEDEGQMFIGCAGGVTTEAVYNLRTSERVPLKLLLLHIGGGIGGHSGDDISKGRANTVHLMLRFLYSQLGKFHLSEINGGGKHNAIARDCTALVLPDDKEAFAKAFAGFGEDIKTEFHATDAGLFVQASEVSGEYTLVDDNQTRETVSSLYACPHGVLAMSQDIKDFVQTSTNLASVRTEASELKVCTSQRSSSSQECTAAAQRVEAALSLGGAAVKHLNPYPGWEPNPNSEILKQCVASYRKLFGVEPQVLAIHAGLECGLFLEKFPDLDMISFGPTLRGVHAPGERLELASLDKFVRHLEDVVCNFH